MTQLKEYYSPAESGKIIAENAKYVTIKTEGIAKLAGEMVSNLKAGNFKDFIYGDDGLHPTANDDNAVDWIFIIDTLNFCFWTPSNKPKWTVRGHTGYYGLTAAIRRAIEEGCDITNPKFYASITEEKLQHIMRSDDNTTVAPLMPTRVKCLHEVGAKLLEKYGGTFKKCIEDAKNSAVLLMKIIVEDFPCFRDESVFENRTLTFYKRAQILVSDIWSCYNGKDWGEFSDIDKITMFADYRVPQALVHFGVMEYSRELLDKLRKDEILEYGSREEMEIRGCSIHAVELINQEARKIISLEKSINLKNDSINAVLIDYFLWLYRRKYARELEYIPFHKVYSQFY